MCDYLHENGTCCGACDNVVTAKVSSCNACWDEYSEDELYQCQLCGKLFCSTCMDECSICAAEMCYECLQEHKKVESQLIYDVARAIGSMHGRYWYAANSLDRQRGVLNLEFLSSTRPTLAINIKLKDLITVKKEINHETHEPHASSRGGGENR